MFKSDNVCIITNSNWPYIEEYTEVGTDASALPYADSPLEWVARALHAVQQGVSSGIRVNGKWLFALNIDQTKGLLDPDETIGYREGLEMKFAKVSDLVEGKIK